MLFRSVSQSRYTADMYKNWSIEKRDRMIDVTIETDKELKEIDSYPHTITELRKSEDGINWVVMI